MPCSPRPTCVPAPSGLCPRGTAMSLCPGRLAVPPGTRGASGGVGRAMPGGAGTQRLGIHGDLGTRGTAAGHCPHIPLHPRTDGQTDTPQTRSPHSPGRPRGAAEPSAAPGRRRLLGRSRAGLRDRPWEGGDPRGPTQRPPPAPRPAAPLGRLPGAAPPRTRQLSEFGFELSFNDGKEEKATPGRGPRTRGAAVTVRPEPRGDPRGGGSGKR